MAIDPADDKTKIIYKPNNGFEGKDSLKYVRNDVKGKPYSQIDTATVYIEVIEDEVLLGGYIRTQKKQVLVGIEVELIGAMELKTTTDENGWYQFSVFPNQEYHIAPLFDTNADDGVTTLDIVIMHWHVLGKKYTMSNLDLIACDVNGSGDLTSLDLVETRSVVLHNKKDFRGKNSVEFINNEYTGEEDVFEYKNYLDIIPTVSHLNLDFTAVKRGDAGGNWKQNVNNNSREEQLEEIELILEPAQIGGNNVQVPIKVQDFTDIVGMQFTMEWDPSVYRFEKLSNLELQFVANLGMVSDGKLTVSWNIEDFDGLTLADDVIISGIEFTTLDEARDPNLKITSGVTPALAYNSALEALSITSSSSLKQTFATNELTVYPNPASDVLNIAGWKNEKMSYSIISSTGHTIFSGTYTGENSIQIDDLRQGVYFIQLVDGENNVLNKKFIKH